MRGLSAICAVCLAVSVAGSSARAQPAPNDDARKQAIEHYKNADVLLHDSTYKPEDQATRRNRGFSSYEEACAAARSLGISATSGASVTSPENISAFIVTRSMTPLN